MSKKQKKGEETQEWQKGNNSKLSSMERLVLHNLWLEKHKQDMLKRTTKNIETYLSEEELEREKK